ncbi:hypothetical protein GGF46_002423 [Coemansia sp. RSA 552]|nr:hypothetical protein GGF46_002423 [Coemansia sp. RSA 552]
MAESSRSGAARRRGSDSVGLGGGPAAASFRQAARSAHNRATEPIAEASSHQVRLAENLDGRGVTDFLAQSMPTSISIGAIGGPSPGLHVTAQQHGAQATRPADPADPVSYLQSTTYAADMERDDDRYQPHSADQSPATTGPDRSWGLQGTAVLEEWQLNEAWDRAWMGTAWASARKREKAAGGDAAEPTSKNLSNLLKPRM